MTGRRARPATATAAALMALLATPSALACWPPAAAEAAAVRILQSELTVGALACGRDARYADFVSRQQAALGRHGAALRRHYEAAYGAKAGLRRLDTQVTAFANEASSRKRSWTADYCRFVDALIARATDLPGERLGAFAKVQPHAKRFLRANACSAAAGR